MNRFIKVTLTERKTKLTIQKEPSDFDHPIGMAPGPGPGPPVPPGPSFVGPAPGQL